MALRALLKHFPRLLVSKDLNMNFLVKHIKIITETFKIKNDNKKPLLVLKKGAEKKCYIAEHESDFMLASMSPSVDLKFRDEATEKSSMAEKAS